MRMGQAVLQGQAVWTRPGAACSLRSVPGVPASAAVLIFHIPSSVLGGGGLGGLVFAVRCSGSEVTQITFSHSWLARTGQWSHRGQDGQWEGMGMFRAAAGLKMPLLASRVGAGGRLRLAGSLHEVRPLGRGQDTIAQQP